MVNKSKRERPIHWSTIHNIEILKKVIALLRQEKPGTLLDVGAGNGYLCQHLASLGFSISACDLRPKQFQVKGIPIKKADLNGQLPYHKNSFDYLTCTEVIEHIKNPWHAFHEIARVLKKNGILILSLPNFTNLISRLVFFSRGNFRYFDEWSWQNWGHINPITFTELNLILNHSGFQIKKIQTQREIEAPYRWLLYYLQKTASFIFHFFKIIRQNDDRKDKSLTILETKPLLFGENLIIKCQKT